VIARLASGTGTLIWNAGGVTYTGSTTINNVIRCGGAAHLLAPFAHPGQTGGTLEVFPRPVRYFRRRPDRRWQRTVTFAVVFASVATLAPAWAETTPPP